MKLFPIQYGFHPEPSTESLSTLASWRNFPGIKLFIFAEFTVHPEEFSIGRHFDAACKPRKPATHYIGLGLSSVVERIGKKTIVITLPWLYCHDALFPLERLNASKVGWLT
jgi:hypothetical protein